jgi:hypothetical protein
MDGNGEVGSPGPGQVHPGYAWQIVKMQVALASYPGRWGWAAGLAGRR